MLGPQSAQADFDTDFVFEVEEDEAEVENGDAARETLSDESNWEGEEVEEEELTAEEASRRAQMGDAGSRHLARKAGEITNPFANVLYGYVSEFLYASERYTRLRRGTRYAVLQHLMQHFGSELASTNGRLPTTSPPLIRRKTGSGWTEMAWPKGFDAVAGTGVVSTTAAEGVDSRRRRAPRRDTAENVGRGRSPSAVVVRTIPSPVTTLEVAHANIAPRMTRHTACTMTVREEAQHVPLRASARRSWCHPGGGRVVARAGRPPSPCALGVKDAREISLALPAGEVRGRNLIVVAPILERRSEVRERYDDKLYRGELPRCLPLASSPVAATPRKSPPPARACM